MELLQIIKRLYFLQTSSIEKFRKIFGYYTGTQQYNSFTTKYKRNVIIYYLHSSQIVRNDIDKFIENKSKQQKRLKMQEC